MVLYRSSIIIQKKFVRNKRKSKNFSFFFASRLKKRNAPPGETAPAAVPQEKAGLQTPELQRAQALLQALRPFVNPERALLIDRAIRLLTTAGNVRAAMRAVGALNGLHTA